MLFSCVLGILALNTERILFDTTFLAEVNSEGRRLPDLICSTDCGSGCALVGNDISNDNKVPNKNVDFVSFILKLISRLIPYIIYGDNANSFETL